MNTNIARLWAARREERGAEAVEFALIGPMLFFLLIGLLYTLLLFAAQLSVARSATVGVRYAAIFDESLGRYPTAADVNSKVLNNTPLFASGACATTSLSGGGGPNAPMTLNISCDFPNPLGQAMNGMRNAFFGGGGIVGSTLELTADATARKE